MLSSPKSAARLRVPAAPVLSPAVAVDVVSVADSFVVVAAAVAAAPAVVGTASIAVAVAVASAVAAAAVACAAAAAVDTEAAVGTFPLDSSAEPADIAGVTGGYSSRAPPFPCRSLATAMVAVVAVLRWRSEWVRKHAFAQLQS